MCSGWGLHVAARVPYQCPRVWTSPLFNAQHGSTHTWAGIGQRLALPFPSMALAGTGYSLCYCHHVCTEGDGLGGDTAHGQAESPCLTLLTLSFRGPLDGVLSPRSLSLERPPCPHSPPCPSCESSRSDRRAAGSQHLTCPQHVHVQPILPALSPQPCSSHLLLPPPNPGSFPGVSTGMTHPRNSQNLPWTPLSSHSSSSPLFIQAPRGKTPRIIEPFTASRCA